LKKTFKVLKGEIDAKHILAAKNFRLEFPWVEVGGGVMAIALFACGPSF
jgi:hypothetical protein